jgi:general secretion pathway protein K
VTPVNVNTAPAEVLSAVVPNLSLAEANSWVVRRQQAPWREKSYFESQLNIDTSNAVPNAYDVKSDWFLIDSRIRLDRAALDAEALIHRAAGLATSGGSQVVWIRQY